MYKATRKLNNENQVVCVESLKVKNMIRNLKLSKAIADAGWSELVRQLRYKGEWVGRSVVASCPQNAVVIAAIPCPKWRLTLVRSWGCPECGEYHDRDINEARNIKAAGLAVLAHDPESQHAA